MEPKEPPRLGLVVGRQGSTNIIELLGEVGQAAPDLLRARDVYEAALDTYFPGRFREAAAGFRAAAQISPDDRAAPMMAARAESLLAHAPAPDWNGVHVLTGK